MKKVRFGVLGVAKIATLKVVPAMKQCRLAEVVGIASRDLEKARAAAAELGLKRAYGGYEALLADTEIDAVYIPLPNHLHVPLSIKAIEAGKHVLCEKPIAPTVAEARLLVETSRRYPDRKVMEAFMYRFHPQWQEARRLVREGELGEARTIQTAFSYYNRDPDNVRNQLGLGGGGLLDIGCYPISLSRFLFESEPRRAIGAVERDPDFEVDRLTSAILDFGDRTSTFTCSMQLVPYQRVNVFGTKGRYEIEIPFNAPPDRPTKAWLETSEGEHELVFDVCDQYTLQGDAFAQAVLDDVAVPTPLEDAVANLAVIEAILRSSVSGRWEPV